MVGCEARIWMESSKGVATSAFPVVNNPVTVIPHTQLALRLQSKAMVLNSFTNTTPLRMP